MIFIEIECFFFCNQSIQFADINQVYISGSQIIVSRIDLFLIFCCCIANQCLCGIQSSFKLIPCYFTVVCRDYISISINQRLQLSIVKHYRRRIIYQGIHCRSQFLNHILNSLLIFSIFKHILRFLQRFFKDCPRLSTVLCVIQLFDLSNQSLQLADVNQSLTSFFQSDLCRLNSFIGRLTVSKYSFCVVQSFNEVVPSYKAIIAFCKLLSFDVCNQSLQGANINQSVKSFIQLSKSIIDVFLR